MEQKMHQEPQSSKASDWIEVITSSCCVCGKRSRVKVPEDGFTAWKSGELIQNALPHLTEDERELLITGTHPLCWDGIFKTKNKFATLQIYC